MTVTKENVFLALNGSGPGAVNFEGCTGIVSFDPSTGSRSVAAEVPAYDLVSLTPSYWEVRLNEPSPSCRCFSELLSTLTCTFREVACCSLRLNLFILFEKFVLLNAPL